MKICGFVKNFNDAENLERCLSQLKRICDYIVVCDDSSTDNSLEVIKKYTKDYIVLPDEFEKELLHKQKLLEFALEKHPDISWFLHLDSDEVLCKEGEKNIRKLCERGEKEGIDGFEFHVVNLYLSPCYYRIDNQFNQLWKCILWRNNGRLKFPSKTGLHMPQHPEGINKIERCPYQILHYGFASLDAIKRKFNTYRTRQKGWALYRLVDTRNLNLAKVPEHWFPPDLIPNNEPQPKPFTREDYEKHFDLPLVSICTPAYIDDYRALKWLRDCIEGSVKQYYPNIEILVCDDGSPLGSEVKRICEDYKVRYIRNEENKGIGYTRNRLINEAKGKYIYFISADDFLAPNAVDTMMDSVYRDEGFLFSDFAVIDENNVLKYHNRIERYGNYEDMVMAAVEAAKRHRMFICYNIFASKELWKTCTFWNDKTFGEDLAHLLEAMLVRRIKFIHIPEFLFYYRESQTMTTVKKRDRIIENNRDTFERINKLLNKKVL